MRGVVSKEDKKRLLYVNDDVLRNNISKKGREFAERYDWGTIAKIAENGIMNQEEGFR